MYYNYRTTLCRLCIDIYLAMRCAVLTEATSRSDAMLPLGNVYAEGDPAYEGTYPPTRFVLASQARPYRLFGIDVAYGAIEKHWTLPPVRY